MTKTFIEIEQSPRWSFCSVYKLKHRSLLFSVKPSEFHRISRTLINTEGKIRYHNSHSIARKVAPAQHPAEEKKIQVLRESWALFGGNNFHKMVFVSLLRRGNFSSIPVVLNCDEKILNSPRAQPV